MVLAGAELPSEARITDYASLGVLTKTFPLTEVQSVQRQRMGTGTAVARRSSPSDHVA
jgi:hypothetical protein